jgi:copper chaperone NosL
MSILLLALSTVGACAPSAPRALIAGQDSCAYCRMTISDVRFGAQYITAKGVIHTFDSVECLAAFLATLPASTPATGGFVTDFNNTDTRVAAEDAIYLVDGRIESPMGRRVVAFAPSANSESLVAEYGGSVQTWPDVRKLLAADTSTQGIAHSHAHAPASASSPGRR